MFDRKRKKGQDLFSTGNIASLSKNCGFSNLLGVTEMTLKRPQYLSEYPIDP